MCALASCTLFSDPLTPAALFDCLAAPLGFLLESADGDTRLARFSMVGVDPLATVSFSAGQATHTRFSPDGQPADVNIQAFDNPMRVLQEVLAEVRSQFCPPDAETLRQQLGCVPPLTGGWVGYLGYGATRYFEGIPAQAADPYAVPDGFFGLYDTVIVYDHLLRRTHFLSYRGEDWLNQVLARCQRPHPPLPALRLSPACLQQAEANIFANIQMPMGKQGYLQAVQRAKGYIVEGQVFQIVPAHRFSMPLPPEASPITVSRLVQAVNPSPYGYVLQCPGFAYVGSSPETFMSCTQQGRVTLRALAGTRPRGKTEIEDAELATALRSNEKELAEHRMLVDLARNDLGRVCDPGSIAVGDIATVVRYTHVMHLATEITGQLRPGFDALDMAQSCFPRGTVSGAPKIRAMQLLAQLEPEQRGIYSGFVGYVDVSGAMDAAIAIRSVLMKDGWAHVSAGAGVVFDSDPEAEYEETCNKAKSMLLAVQLAEICPGVVATP
jgi:anthranilate synthase component 1